MNNPYQSPTTSGLPRNPEDDPQLEKAASGQKLIIYAILLYFLTVGLQSTLGPVALFLIIPCLIMSWMGIYQIGLGLGYAMWLRILHMLCMLIPLVGILVLLVLSARTNARLKDAGYKVGLLGAKR